MERGGSKVRLEMGLTQRQTLTITMTQELQQAIAILQYSAQELTTFLEMKAMENPLIQLETPYMIDHGFYGYSKRKTTYSEPDQKKWLEQIAETPRNLADYLFSQIRMEALSELQRELTKQFIYNLDENGYLNVLLEEVAAEFKTDLNTVNECLSIVQSLDPPGVAARSLQECLQLQVRRKNDVHDLVTTLLTEYFTEFAERKWKSIAAKINVSLADIQSASDFIKTLDPRPGSHFTSDSPQYVTPDLILEMKGGRMVLQLCEHHLPVVTYQSDYYSQMVSYGDSQVKAFLKEKKQDFHWIMNSLEQRRATLIKVGTAILEAQPDFFEGSHRILRPLTMKELAQKIDVHESTVSRTVRGKYMQTPFGMYELKMFFSHALQTSDSLEGEQASASQAKAIIEEMIQAENKNNPLSDQRIAEIMMKRGLALSRRTVAKYREQLRIPSSVKRKRFI